MRGARAREIMRVAVWSFVFRLIEQSIMTTMHYIHVLDLVLGILLVRLSVTGLVTNVQ